MPNFEGFSLSPWLIAGAVLAVGTAIFYVGRWVGDVNAFKSGALVELLREIRDDIRTLLDRVPAVVIARGSPLRLTELGKTVAKEIDAHAWTAALAGELADRAAAMPVSPYDVQEFCVSYMREEYEPTLEQGDRIKSCAYDNGLKREDVLDVLAIELRDTLLTRLAEREEAGS